MDPITATIIGGVLWLFLGGFASVIVYFLIALIIGGIGSDRGSRFATAVVVGWLASFLWGVFVIIQVIIHVVRLIQLLMGVEVTI